MIISEADLTDMLSAREARAKRQAELIEKYRRPLICFTMNIAGSVKLDSLIALSFREGLSRIRASGLELLCEEISIEHTGCTAYIVADGSAEQQKKKMCEVEEHDALSRLFDIDVIGADGEKLSRDKERECVVCGGSVKACARSRAHGLDAVRRAMYSRMTDVAAEKFSHIAHDALVYEVSVTPKPGLVDRASNGAHTDMDISTFIKSAAAVHPYFAKMLQVGAENALRDAAEVMALLRREGVLAERAMLEATGGVNTHRGAIYTLGLLLGGLGASLVSGGSYIELAARLAAVDAEAELRRAANVSHGGGVYARYGARGIRFEAAEGFPAARAARSSLKRHIEEGFSENDAGVLALAETMERLADTNVLHRAGAEGLSYMREAMRAVSELPIGERIDEMARLDAEFTERGISSGGAADVLAAAKLMYEAERLMD